MKSRIGPSWAVNEFNSVPLRTSNIKTVPVVEAAKKRFASDLENKSFVKLSMLSAVLMDYLRDKSRPYTFILLSIPQETHNGDTEQKIIDSTESQ